MCEGKGHLSRTKRFRIARKTDGSGTEWESRVGYSWAVRVGPHVGVSGTTATDDGGTAVGDDAYGQAKRAIENVAGALERVGAGVEDVVGTRLFVVDLDDWESVGRVHGEAFADVRPTTSVVEVSRSIDPAVLVEVEALAIVADD